MHTLYKSLCVSVILSTFTMDPSWRITLHYNFFTDLEFGFDKWRAKSQIQIVTCHLTWWSRVTSHSLRYYPSPNYIQHINYFIFIYHYWWLSVVNAHTVFHLVDSSLQSEKLLCNSVWVNVQRAHLPLEPLSLVLLGLLASLHVMTNSKVSEILSQKVLTLLHRFEQTSWCLRFSCWGQSRGSLSQSAQELPAVCDTWFQSRCR